MIFGSVYLKLYLFRQNRSLSKLSENMLTFDLKNLIPYLEGNWEIVDRNTTVKITHINESDDYHFEFSEGGFIDETIGIFYSGSVHSHAWMPHSASLGHGNNLFLNDDSFTIVPNNIDSAHHSTDTEPVKFLFRRVTM